MDKIRRRHLGTYFMVWIQNIEHKNKSNGEREREDWKKQRKIKADGEKERNKSEILAKKCNGGPGLFTHSPRNFILNEKYVFKCEYIKI